MAQRTIGLGIALVLLGIIVTVLSSSGSVTSLIPTFIGAIFVGIGLVASQMPERNRDMMHIAAAVALLAILGSLGSLIGRGSGGWALFSQLVTVVLCGGFLFLAIQSFKEARAARD